MDTYTKVTELNGDVIFSIQQVRRVMKRSPYIHWTHFYQVIMVTKG